MLIFFYQIPFAADYVVIKSRDVMLVVFVAPFLGFDPKKRQAEDKGQQQHSDLHLAIAELRGTHRHRDGQAAANQDGRIKSANGQRKAPAGSGEFWEVPASVNQIGAEHSTEEHDFSSQEPPHTEGGRIALLLDIGKVVTQFGAVFVLQHQRAFPRPSSIAQGSPLQAKAWFHIRTLPKSQSESRQN